jgi:hypothetical protein
MERTICKLEIKKSQSGWSYFSTVKYPGWLENHTSGGYTSLKSVLWHVIRDIMTLPDNPVLERITVNGLELNKSDALQIIIKALKGSALDYSIPEYQKFLTQ